MALQQLHYVVTIINCGSISGAAKQLFITQPSLSNAVKGLEKEMGISVFGRSSGSIALSSQGMEFLSYARQVLEQTELLEQHYTDKKPVKRTYSISIQYYAFAVNALTNLMSRQSANEYEFTLGETRTYKAIDDVKNYRSKLGILYINGFNRKVLKGLFKGSGLVFHPLLQTNPHVFTNVSHPLSVRKRATIEDLENYLFLAFEQGEKDSFYFSEEILGTIPKKRVIYVSDGTILSNLLIGLSGYTVYGGILNRSLNGDSVMAVPLETKDNIFIGWIADPRVHLSQFARKYLEGLNRLIDGQP